MPASIGVNLRVTGHCSQGGRKYMEDLFSVAYQQTEDERDLEYAFFGIYDGHGGSEAAAFAKEHLMDSIVKQRQFWSDDDEDVLKAIRNGYMLTHLNMWKELEKWPKTVTGLPSTAGTTASVAFIRRGKIYIGHVGDSAIVLGYQKNGSEEWEAKPLTLDHKPESTAEMDRIQSCGGKVVSKAGVPRVVWNRPRAGHKGPIKKNTPMDEIPFLAVARSLGDLWSYNNQNDEFIVSPDPDVGVLTIDPTKFKCLIFGTDGLWNMISPEGAVSLVQATEKHNESALVSSNGGHPRDWLNPSKSLVDHALERWSNTRMRADNTSVVTLMLDPPGPPRAAVLRSRVAAPPPASAAGDPPSGLTIMTRYSEPPAPAPPAAAPTPPAQPLPPCAELDSRFSLPPATPERVDPPKNNPDLMTNYGNPAESYFIARLLSRTRLINTLEDVSEQLALAGARTRSETHRSSPPPPPQTVVSEGETRREAAATARHSHPAAGDDTGIQINEVSSSSPVDHPPKQRPRRPKSEGKKDAEPSHRVLRSHEPESTRAPTTLRSGARRIASVAAATLQPQRLTRSRDPPVTLTARVPRVLPPTPTATPVAAPTPAAPGNWSGAGSSRPRRRQPAPDCCKENVRRGPAQQRRRRPDRAEEHEVHSTTSDPCLSAGPPVVPASSAPTRALRPRNEAEAPAQPPAGKRARHEGKRPASGAAPVRRAAPPPPALVLRSRLRRRRAK